MKKIVAILLMGVLLFNWVGYELYTAVMQQRANHELIARLDLDDYADAELVSFRFPATGLGYYKNDVGFNRVDGTVKIEGVQYNYVKRRIYNDSLELLCIPNKSVTRLQTARDDFFKLVNDLQHPGHSKKAGSDTTSFKSITGDYYDNSTVLLMARYSGSLVAAAADRYLFAIPDMSSTPAGQPPDRA